MDIQDYSDLTDFVSAESNKSEDLTVQCFCNGELRKFLNDSLIKYTKLYSNHLFAREKRKVNFEIAVETQPHGFIWKIFHWDLWKRVKEYNKLREEQKEKEQEKPKNEPVKEVLVPTIVRDRAEPPYFKEGEENG